MNIQEAQQKLSAITTYKELVSLVRPICAWQKKVNSRQRVLYALLIFFVLASLVIVVSTKEGDSNSSVFNLMLVGGIGIVAVLAYVINKTTIQTKSLSQRIVLRALELKYGFTAGYDLPDRFKILPEVNRPYDTRTPEIVTKGVYEGSLHALEYHFCHMRYTKEEDRGNHKTKVTTQRSFLFIKFPWVKGIALRNDGNQSIDYPVRSKAAEKEFNGKFVLTGTAEMNCARFAKPMTVLHMLKFTGILLRPNFVFTQDGWLCIGFSNEDVFASEITASLKKPAAFYRMIRGGIQMPFMTRLMRLVHQLAEQHDDNFAENIKGHSKS